MNQELKIACLAWARTFVDLRPAVPLLSRVSVVLGAALVCSFAMPMHAQQFVQVSPLYFTVPLGGLPIFLTPQVQNFIVTSAGPDFVFSTKTQTFTGGNWLRNGSGDCTACNTPSFQSATVDAPGSLPVGTYTGAIIFSGGSSTMTVSVTLAVVGPGQPFFGTDVSELGFVFGGGTASKPLPQTIQVTNARAGSLNWTLTAIRSKEGTG